MSQEKNGPGEAGTSSHDDDEIEIIEVVGVEDDGVPPSGDPDKAEVEVDFEGGGEDGQPSEMETIDTATEEEPSPESDRERLLRLHAEFDNLRKRYEREKEDFYKHATSELLKRLLPVVDNLERALGIDTGEDDAKAFREGVVLIHRQLMEELRKEGLRPVEAIGMTFDPSRHEAVATECDLAYPLNAVIEEFQRGYFFQDRLLRPAMVKVNVEPDFCQQDEDVES